MTSTSALTDRVTLWSCEQADTVARELLPLKRALKVKTFWDSASDLQHAELLSLSLSCLRTHAAKHSQPPGTLRLFDAYLLFSLPCACNQLDHINLQHCVLVHSLAHSLTPSLAHVSFARVRYTQFCISSRLPCLAAVHAACTGMPAHVDKFPWLGQVSLANWLTSYWLLVTVSVPHCLVYTLDTVKWLQCMSQCGKLVYSV